MDVLFVAPEGFLRLGALDGTGLIDKGPASSGRDVWKGGKEAYSYSRQKRGPRGRLFGRDGGAPGAIYFERGAWC